jgi:hypothetical protein
MNILLIIVFALVFPLVHILNGWIFRFAEITPHIGLIYLPAFLRLAHVLILGRVSGTLATLLGSLLLMWYSGDNFATALLNGLCSAGGPLVALCLFRWHVGRDVELTSLKDLTLLTLIYAIANAVLHHTAWSIVDPSQLQAPVQVVWMIAGDILGTLLGAYILRWGIFRYRYYKLERELD